MPGCKVVLTSNGHYLTPEVAEMLLDLGEDLHEIYVSVQGIDKGAYEATMRGSMNFDRTLSHVHHFLEAQRRRGAGRPKLWITMVDTGMIDARKAIAYWQSQGVAAKYTTLENRGGNIKDADAYSRTHRMSCYDACQRLFKQGYILFNGDMVLCCADYGREQVLGNITSRSIDEVWNGPVACDIRRRYIDREFAGLPLCGRCKIDEMREVSVDVDGREIVQAVE